MWKASAVEEDGGGSSGSVHGRGTQELQGERLTRAGKQQGVVVAECTGLGWELG